MDQSSPPLRALWTYSRTAAENELGVMAKWQTRLYRIIACRLNLGILHIWLATKSGGYREPRQP
jgi:hypothetical protein